LIEQSLTSPPTQYRYEHDQRTLFKEVEVTQNEKLRKLGDRPRGTG